MVAMIGPCARLLIRKTKRARARERERDTKYKENKQQSRRAYAWIGSEQRVSLRARWWIFFLSAGAIFIAGETSNREKRVHECTRVRSFTRANGGQSYFSRDAARIRRAAPSNVYLAMRSPGDVTPHLNIASAIRLRDLPPPAEIRASNCDQHGAREKERSSPLPRKIKYNFPRDDFSISHVLPS